MGDFKKIPAHIGIIPDGNRRWALQNNMEKNMGYDYGVDPGIKLCELMIRHGVKEATFYGFTKDNNKRPKYQRESYTKACVASVFAMADKDANILCVGNADSPLFPTELLPFANKRVNFGKGVININFLINYDWKLDIETGIKNKRINEILSKDISRIDMIIRWGGRRRLSGFLPVQSVYSDIFVVDNFWPDFKEQDFFDALLWYEKTDATLGG